MKLTEIIERRAAVAAELKTLFDAAEKAGKDLEGADLEKFNKLRDERTKLTEQEDRAKLRDELDRKAEARDVESRGDEPAAYALTKEQRMADYVEKTTGEKTAGLSIGKVIRSILTGDWRESEAEARVMGGTPNTAGGYFIPNPISANVIDLARNSSVMIQAGALTVPMSTASLGFVKILTDPTGDWRGEGQEIAESDASFGLVTLHANSLAALCTVNAELMDDAPNFAATLDAMLASALALKLDYAGLYGISVIDPAGIRGTDGVQEVSMGDNGAVPTDYDDFLDVINKIELANGAPTTMIWSPRDKNTMAKLVTGITSDKTKLTPPADFTALRRLVSNQVKVDETQGSTNAASTAFFGGFENYAFGMRQQIQIEASKVSGDAFKKNQVQVRAILRADGVAFRASLLGRLIGIKAS